jgi:hypothetical protein
MKASNITFSSDFQIRYNDRLQAVWRSSTPGRGKRVFAYSTASRPALKPTQLPMEEISGAFSPGIKRTGRVPNKMHPVPRSSIAELYLLFPIWPRGRVLN